MGVLSNSEGKLSVKKTGLVVFAVVGLILILGIAPMLIETNNEGEYRVNQGALSGEITIRNEAGPYAQLFDKVTSYQISDMYYFSKSNLDGGDSEFTDPIKVRFNDGGTALVSGAIKFRLSLKEEDQRELHRDFKSYRAVKNDLVRQVVTEALMQTATLMKAEDSYSTRRSEFTSLAEEQIRQGIFETVSKEVKVKDADDNEFINKIVNVKLGEDGNPVVRKSSPFRSYNVKILQFVIKDIDFDETIDALIAKKKESEQAKVVAKAQAEQAKQDAITAKERGNARVAQAKADEEVEKIKAVTQAKKEKEVAELAAEKKFVVAKLQAKEALETAKKIEAEGQAKALANQALVRSGLTPQERAEWEFKTKVGVAEQLSKLNLPKIMISGGAKGNGGANPIEMIGLEHLMKINERLSK